ncbi:hypothetical protein TNCV_2980451 [Trichonephila clavipes]|nr:hypothetical protein TNCV_2980451 [Trichonephila clavipes]
MTDPDKEEDRKELGSCWAAKRVRLRNFVGSFTSNKQFHQKSSGVKKNISSPPRPAKSGFEPQDGSCKGYVLGVSLGPL